MRGKGGVRKMNLRKKKEKEKEPEQRMEISSWSQAENVVANKMKKDPGFLSFSIGTSNHYAHYKVLFQSL